MKLPQFDIRHPWKNFGEPLSQPKPSQSERSSPRQTDLSLAKPSVGFAPETKIMVRNPRLAIALQSPHAQPNTPNLSPLDPEAVSHPRQYLEYATSLIEQGRFSEASDALKQAQRENFHRSFKSDPKLTEEIKKLSQAIHHYQNDLPGQFKKEISQLQDKSTRLEGEALRQLLDKLSFFEVVQDLLRQLAQLKLDHPEAHNFSKLAQEKILSGILKQDPVLLQEGLDLSQIVLRYAEAEKAARSAETQWKNQYPSHSSINFQLVYSEQNPRVRDYIPEPGYLTGRKVLPENEPPLSRLRELSIVRTYEKLKSSPSSQAQALATHAEEVLQFFQSPQLTLNNPSELLAYTQQLEGLFSNGTLDAFFQEVEFTNHTAIQDQPSYQQRVRLAAELENLQIYAELEIVLSSKDTVPAQKDLETVQKLLLALTEQQARKLEGQRLEALDANKDKARTATQTESYWGGAYDPTVSSQIQSIQAQQSRLAEIQKTLSDTDCSKTEAQTHLLKLGQALAEYQETQTRQAIAKQLQDLSSLSSLSLEDLRLVTLYRQLGNAEGPLTERLSVYQKIVADSDALVLVHTARAEAEHYRGMAKNIQTTDRVFNGISKTNLAMTLLGNSSDPWQLVRMNNAETFLDMAQHYEEIAAQADAGNLASARQTFVDLQQSRLGDRLQGMHDFSEKVNTYGVGIGIILASAATGGLGAGYLGYSAGSWGFYAASGTGFTLSHRLLWAGVTNDWTMLYDPQASLGENASGLAGETALNIGMFAFLGKSLGLFHHSFESIAHSLAARQLRQLGITAPSTEQLALATSRLQNTWQGTVLKSSGAFGTELAAFGAYDFLGSSAQSLLQGSKEPFASVQDKLFSPQAWTERFFFLVALKIGGALASPITKLSHQTAENLVLAKWRPALEEAQALLTAAHENLAEGLRKGSPDLAGLIEAYRGALSLRLDIMEKLPPHYRNAGSIAATQQALASLDQFTLEREIFEKMLHTGNRYNIVFTTSGYGLVPAPHFFSFLHDLRVYSQRPHSPLSNVREYSNGLVEVDYHNAVTGEFDTLRFTREGFPSAKNIATDTPLGNWMTVVSTRLGQQLLGFASPLWPIPALAMAAHNEGTSSPATPTGQGPMQPTPSGTLTSMSPAAQLRALLPKFQRELSSYLKNPKDETSWERLKTTARDIEKSIESLERLERTDAITEVLETANRALDEFKKIVRAQTLEASPTNTPTSYWTGLGIAQKELQSLVDRYKLLQGQGQDNGPLIPQIEAALAQLESTLHAAQQDPALQNVLSRLQWTREHRDTLPQTVSPPPTDPRLIAQGETMGILLLEGDRNIIRSRYDGSALALSTQEYVYAQVYLTALTTGKVARSIISPDAAPVMTLTPPSPPPSKTPQLIGQKLKPWDGREPLSVFANRLSPLYSQALKYRNAYRNEPEEVRFEAELRILTPLKQQTDRVLRLDQAYRTAYAKSQGKGSPKVKERARAEANQLQVDLEIETVKLRQMMNDLSAPL